jgi:O-antigen/teichoic acid export membrane protein
MSNEARKGFVRILSNYTRLLTTLGLGILVVPLTIHWLGDDAFGIISLLGANIGLAGIFRQIIQMSLVRELGQAYHADDETFRRSYATICVIALVCALLSVVSFGIVYALVPVFQIPAEFVGPARWFVFGQGVYTAAMIILSPMLNMYLVKENFIGYNLWYIAVRAGNIVSVLILGYVVSIDNPPLGLTLHGLTWAGLAIIGMVIATAIIISKDHRLMFRIKGSDKDARSQVFSTFSWNTGVQIAMNLHEQIPPLLLNLFFGTLANAAWGVGFRFVAYIRMCTTGVQFGSDAVSARLAAGDDSEGSRKKLQRLMYIQTKLTSMIALPAAFIVFVYGWPIFDIWVGKSLTAYDEVMPIAVNMSRILAVALVARAISDSWLIILYGAGFVKAYAPWVFAGGVFAPLASIILMFTLPESMIVYAPPTMFALVLVVIHLFGLPIIAGRCLHIKPTSLLIALCRPLIAVGIALACSLGMLSISNHTGDLGFWGSLTFERGQSINWAWMLGSIGVFGAVYSFCSYVFVLESSERQRITKLILGRFVKKST